MSLALEARRLLRAQRHGTLGTLSTALSGYPYCSVVPYVLDHHARPVVLVSRLAEHTHNIEADARVCLFAHEVEPDVQTGSRVTLMGTAKRITEPDPGIERYARYFPSADAYRHLDFDFYRIAPVSLRAVAGFAKVHWISREAYTPPDADFDTGEPALLDDLNARLGEALRDYCAVQLETDASSATIVGVDCDGFDVLAGGRYWRLAYAGTARDAGEAASHVERTLRSRPA